MATLIPTLSTCLSRMTSGEKRLARRLEEKLEDDYLIWYDVPIGHRNLHPDFIVLNPRRGLLILEVKDWKPETVQEIDRSSARILTPGGLKSVPNPLEQARQYAHAVTNRLEQDPQLVFPSGTLAGKLMLPWSYGVVLTNITRKQFTDGQLDQVLEPRRIICSDEMTETIDAEAFQSRLWDMFPFVRSPPLSMPQIDRIRWAMFPEIRLGAGLQAGLFDDPPADQAPAAIPDIVRVMDLQQEQLARSLGEGHRVIHGVAGSGKTLILCYRAEQLAKVCTKPVLVLCYNTTLAKRLRRMMDDKGVSDRVNVHNFHEWVRSQLKLYHVGLPPDGADKDAWFAATVDRLIAAIDRGQVPKAQYDAVLIDEGHDFEAHWFKLLVQMVDPATNSLLVMYDDAQDIYQRKKQGRFSFRSVGIQAQGRTTILRVNYRNTQEILRLASTVASDLLKPAPTETAASDDDGIPQLTPLSGGAQGSTPLIIRLPTLRDEAEYLAAHLHKVHENGTPWTDMAVIYHHYRPVGQTVLSTLRQRGIPCMYHKDMQFGTADDGVRFLTMHSCKGLEFPLVAIPGIGEMRGADGDRKELSRLLYVAMTRATRDLVVLDGGATIADCGH